MVLPPLLMLRDTRGVVGLATVQQQQPQSQMPPQLYDSYAMGLLQVGFSFKVELPTNLLLYVGVCYCV